MEELSYTSKFDGETTDDILGYANEGKTEKVNEYVKSMNVQDSKGEPDTVQVYDTDGVPHKVSKTELLKKSTLALPKLEDISSFVAVNAKGDAVGVMTKEDIAKVLAGLIGTVTGEKDGLMSKSGFIERGDISDANTRFSGFLRTAGMPNTPYPSEHGILVSISTSSVCLQFFLRGWPVQLYWRSLWDNWNSWNRIG